MLTVSWNCLLFLEIVYCFLELLNTVSWNCLLFLGIVPNFK